MRISDERAGYWRLVNAARTKASASLADAAASTTGTLLAGAARALTRARPSVKPLHPRGDVVTGTLVRTGTDRPSGVPWLDSPGTDEVLVRLSRAIGLPGPLPDIHGLALRVPVAAGHADLLLAGTALGRWTRFVLLPGRDIAARPLTTLLPYRGPRGPLFIAARATTGAPGPGQASPLTFELRFSQGSGSWVPFARLDVSTTAGPDPAVSFDPITHPLPGLDIYPWVRRLREPAYRAARDASGRA